MKDSVCQMLRQKNIILFGPGEKAVAFCERFRHAVNIKYCVTGYSSEAVEQPMSAYGLETKVFDDTVFKGDEYFIICGDFQPAQWALRSEGLREYESFISADAAAALLEEKRIAVFMGSSTMRQIAMGFSLQPEASGFACQFFWEGELLKPYANRMTEYCHAAGLCDMYVTSVCDRQTYGAKLLPGESLPEGCLRIRVSDYTFNGWLPQICPDRDVYSNYLFREFMRIHSIPYNTLALAREDTNLATFVRQDISVEEILKRISALDLYSREQVLANFDLALDRVKDADKISDVQLADHIGRARKNPYRNLDEWDTETVVYVLEQIGDIAGLAFSGLNTNALSNSIEKNLGTELPVYPSVCVHLGSSFDADKKYKVVTYYKVRYLDFSDYIRYCVENMYRVRALLQLLGTESSS